MEEPESQALCEQPLIGPPHGSPAVEDGVPIPDTGIQAPEIDGGTFEEEAVKIDGTSEVDMTSAASTPGLAPVPVVGTDEEVQCPCSQYFDLNGLFKKNDGLEWDEQSWVTLEKWFVLHFHTKGCRTPRTTKRRGLYMILTGRWRVHDVLLSVGCPTFGAIGKGWPSDMRKRLKQQFRCKDTFRRFIVAEDEEDERFYTTDKAVTMFARGQYRTDLTLELPTRWVLDRRVRGTHNKLSLVYFQKFDWWYSDDHSYCDRRRDDKDLWDSEELDMPSTRLVWRDGSLDRFYFYAGSWRHEGNAKRAIHEFEMGYHRRVGDYDMCQYDDHCDRPIGGGRPINFSTTMFGNDPVPAYILSLYVEW